MGGGRPYISLGGQEPLDCHLHKGGRSVFVPFLKSSRFFVDITWTSATKARGSQPFASCYRSIFAQISLPSLYHCGPVHIVAPGNSWIHGSLLENLGEPEHYLRPSVLAPSLHSYHGMKLQTACGASPGGLKLLQSMRPEKWASRPYFPTLISVLLS